MPNTQFFERTITLSPQSEPAGLKFSAKLAFWTFGNPSNPAIFMPTCFGSALSDTLPFLYSTEHRPDPILPPSRYFIIIAGLLGGGESSSPSNTPEPFHGPNFPRTTYEDNVRFQHALCESLGINKLFAYIGFSMGGQQAYHMSTLFPEFVENSVCLASSARISWHCWSVLETLKYALVYSSDFQNGHYTEPPKKGLRALDRIFSTWALPPQKGDITMYYPEDRGDLAKTLERINARCLIMPSRTDQFFSPEHSEEEVKHLKRGEFICVESVFGHLAGGGMGTKDDSEFIVEEIRRFLLA
ncbi:hypothetical protein EG329_000888 [Mollisiaceae sp. DMI_Dod_QoI]|nr:hypothetical protein EG329_000888 [Helotiales sp. DMI_Dod_QoI]